MHLIPIAHSSLLSVSAFAWVGRGPLRAHAFRYKYKNHRLTSVRTFILTNAAEI